MPIKREGLPLLTALSVTALMGVSTNIHAQDEQKLDEEVIVTGFRQSLANALNAKRNAQNVVDAISAEDIGKSADQNIAEALQRVTGVSIDRADGEGTTISIRGTGPSLNNITLNGVTLTSTGANQAVDFSQFSSDILSAIEVIKTPSADHDEGSLGATVKLKGFKPLNAKKNRRSIELQWRTNTLAQEDGFDAEGLDHKINVSFSEKLFNDSVGISVVASTEEQTSRTDRFDTTWWRPFTPSNGVTVNRDLDDNGQLDDIVTEWDLDGDGVAESIAARHPRQVQYRHEENKRDRDTISTTIQFKPTDRTDVQFDMTYSDQYTFKDNNQIATTPNFDNRRAEDLLWDPDTFNIIRNVHTASGDGLTNPSNRDTDLGIIRVTREIIGTKQRNKVFGGSIEHLEGDFTFSLRGGRSKSVQQDDTYLQGIFRGITTPTRNPQLRNSGIQNGFECEQGNDRCRLILTLSPNDGENSPSMADRPSLMQFQTFNLRDRGIEDTSSTVFFDVDWDVSFGPVTRLETGLKWSEREKDNFQSNEGFNRGAVGGVLNNSTLADFLDDEQTPSDWGEGLGFARDDITDGWSRFDVERALAFVTTTQATPSVKLNLNNTRNIQQEVFGAYVKANFDMFDGRMTGDMGVRYATTDVEAAGFSGFNYESQDFFNTDNLAFYGDQTAAFAALGRNTLANDPTPTFIQSEHSYDNVLPSLNLNFLLTDDLIMRFAVSKTLARPRIDRLQPNFSVKELQFSSTSEISSGNTQLNPFLSTNQDLSVEWYFADDSLLSVALFNKDFSDFEEEASFLAHWADVRDEFYDVDGNLLPEDQISFVPDLNNVILDIRNGQNQAGCMPNREGNMASTIGLTGCDIVSVKQARNGQGGYVRGVETNIQHNFTYLPSLLGHTGISANYTYSDSEIDEEVERDENGNITRLFAASPFPLTSEHTYNMTLFYENKGRLLRLAYNNRSDYLVSRAERDSTAVWVEGFDTLDLSASWEFNKNVSAHLQAINLTDTVTKRYNTIVTDPNLPSESLDFDGATKSRTARLSNTGTIYRLSARITF